MANQSSISAFSEQKAIDRVTKAEVYFATSTAEHNLVLTITKLSEVMFPDNAIAASSGRTKTTAIITLMQLHQL